MQQMTYTEVQVLRKQAAGILPSFLQNKLDKAFQDPAKQRYMHTRAKHQSAFYGKLLDWKERKNHYPNTVQDSYQKVLNNLDNGAVDFPWVQR